MNNETKHPEINSWLAVILFFAIITLIVILLINAVLNMKLIENNSPPTTEEEYNKLANYTIKTTEDEYKLESNIYTNCALFFPDDKNCTKELKIRIFNISRFP